MDRSYQARIARLLLLACLPLAFSAGCGRTEPAPAEATAFVPLHYEFTKAPSTPQLRPEPIEVAQSNVPTVQPEIVSPSIATNEAEQLAEKPAIEQIAKNSESEAAAREHPSIESQTSDEPTAEPAPLPWGPSTPSPELDAISLRAEEAARRGFNLAERGALYSARAQFIESLRIIADVLDSQLNTNAHSRALSAGLRALEEVNDFVPRATQTDGDLDLRRIIESHRTPVLKNQSTTDLTVSEAERVYLTYAQEQLAAAGGDQPAASLAFHGLGKICAAPAEMHGPKEQIAQAKAVVYFQAALQIEPKNFIAANELGVLLTRFGRLDAARSVFEHAVESSDTPAAWRNLAVVCDRQGELARAAEARQNAAISIARLQKNGYVTAGMKYPIEWIDPETFARTNSMMIAAQYGPQSASILPQTPTLADPSAAPAQSVMKQPAATAAKPSSSGGIWPWNWK